MNRNNADLVEARMLIRNWVNSYKGKSIEEFKNSLIGLEFKTLDEDGKPLIEYECDDYTLQFRFHQNKVVNVIYWSLSEEDGEDEVIE